MDRTILSMFKRLVLANSLFSRPDINLTLGLLPQRRHVAWRDSVGVESSTILNKIKWNSKPPTPQIKDEAARRAKTRHFPILDLGGGGSRFSIYFVQDCNLGQNKMEQQTSTPLPPPPNQGWSGAKGKNATFSHPWFFFLIFPSIYFVQDCRLVRWPVRDIAIFFFLKLSRDKLKLSRDKMSSYCAINEKI